MGRESLQQGSGRVGHGDVAVASTCRHIRPCCSGQRARREPPQHNVSARGWPCGLWSPARVPPHFPEAALPSCARPEPQVTRQKPEATAADDMKQAREEAVPCSAGGPVPVKRNVTITPDSTYRHPAPDASARDGRQLEPGVIVTLPLAEKGPRREKEPLLPAVQVSKVVVPVGFWGAPLGASLFIGEFDVLGKDS